MSVSEKTKDNDHAVKAKLQEKEEQIEGFDKKARAVRAVTSIPH